jgi:hypothetical protein
LGRDDHPVFFDAGSTEKEADPQPVLLKQAGQANFSVGSRELLQVWINPNPWVPIPICLINLLRPCLLQIFNFNQLKIKKLFSK